MTEDEYIDVHTDEDDIVSHEDHRDMTLIAIDMEEKLEMHMTPVDAFREQFERLQEINIIKLGFLTVIIIGSASIVGMFVPYVYAIVPAPQSSVCLC